MRSFLLFCLLAVQAPFALAWQGIVDQAVDGNTLKIRNEAGRVANISLYGIAAPKLSQASGPEALAATKKMAVGKSVRVEPVHVDEHGTIYAVVYINDQYTLQAFLTGSGLAWVYDGKCELEICTSWERMVSQAKTASLGLWGQPNPVAPWKWQQKPAKKAAAAKKPVKKRKPAVKKAKPAAEPEAAAEKPAVKADTAAPEAKAAPAAPAAAPAEKPAAPASAPAAKPAAAAPAPAPAAPGEAK